MEVASNLQSDAFKRLYPEQFYARFIQDGLRPDGRTLGRSRAVSIMPDAVPSAEASASVKIGNTTAVAGIKLEVFIPPEDAPDKGVLRVNVELTPLCSAEWRPGRPSESTHVITDAITRILHTPGTLDLTTLCIRTGLAAFLATIDIFILDADGSLVDAALLAAVTSLSCLKLPTVAFNPEGGVKRVAEEEAAEGAAAGKASQGGEAAGVEKRLSMSCTPLCVTCGVYNGSLIVDPTADEESLMPTMVTVALNEKTQLLGMFKPGGSLMTTQMLHNCIEAAALNYKPMYAALQQAIQSRGQAMREEGV